MSWEDESWFKIRQVAGVTRVEVIDEKGRRYVMRNCRIAIDIQDEGRTMKVFVKPPMPVAK